MPNIFSQKSIFLLLVSLLILGGCSSQQKQWEYTQTIELGAEMHPLGLAHADNRLWVSLPDQKRLVSINENGKVIDEITDLERPMHLASHRGTIFVPIYLGDYILAIRENKTDTLSMDNSLDAPASISVTDDTVAVVDFYNHRVILDTNDTTKSIGEKGNAEGQLFYPTDVELYGGKIYVADAYNHRLQVFDTDGRLLQVIGNEKDINVANGIAVHDGQIFAADFYNNRVLVFDTEGQLLQTLTGQFEKPTGISIADGQLYIANFGKNSIVKYTLK